VHRFLPWSAVGKRYGRNGLLSWANLALPFWANGPTIRWQVQASVCALQSMSGSGCSTEVRIVTSDSLDRLPPAMEAFNTHERKFS